MIVRYRTRLTCCPLVYRISSEGFYQKRSCKRAEIRYNNKVASATNNSICADMAELADAHGSGPCEGYFMGVRIPLSAPVSKKTPFVLVSSLKLMSFIRGFEPERA